MESISIWNQSVKGYRRTWLRCRSCSFINRFVAFEMFQPGKFPKDDSSQLEFVIATDDPSRRMIKEEEIELIDRKENRVGMREVS